MPGAGGANNEYNPQYAAARYAKAVEHGGNSAQPICLADAKK
jgi:hypothetical protein